MSRIFYLMLIVGVALQIATPNNIYSQELGDWIQVTPLPNPCSDCAAVAIGTTIYVLGGYAYTTTPYPVLRTTIQSNGNLTSWIQESTQMKQARYRGVSVYANGYIYAISGGALVTSGDNTTAERAKVNPDGSLSEWTTISSLPQQFFASTWVQTSTFVYVLGSYEGTTDVWRVTLNPDGTMGTWELMSSHFRLPRYGAQAAIKDNYIYIAGGDSGNTVYDQRTVERAFIYPDGTLGPWQSLNNLTEHHVNGMGAIINDKFYIIAGQLFGTPIYQAEFSTIKPDYTLDSWIPNAPRPNPRKFFAHIQTNKGIYVIGGFNGGDMSSVEYAPIIGVTGINKKEWEIFE